MEKKAGEKQLDTEHCKQNNFYRNIFTQLNNVLGKFNRVDRVIVIKVFEAEVYKSILKSPQIHNHNYACQPFNI